ncbi:hypothetical protein B0I35DRAFT_517261 [Stachybotrys elegans]|uniref:C2H2-type domain-containing protein n=1 Tax=Stachybotrys elegans TaxID=80388 RepID=A0A8K0SGT4_9HYPO|nr:hypothetical protein B0I35DRAFT_517261 [Stachybotrys elegans]
MPFPWTNTIAAQKNPLPIAMPPHQSSSPRLVRLVRPDLSPLFPHAPNSQHPQQPGYQLQLLQPETQPNARMFTGHHHQPHQRYGTPTSLMPQTATAPSRHRQIAPAGGRVGPPALRPMPPGGLSMQPGVNVQSPYGQGPLMQPNSILQEGEQPTHIVGSQGCRGILPSTPGQPAAPAAGTATKSTVAKDENGNFLCPRCEKPYKRITTLKRHLLKHTGDRPYRCVLCRDTFSRSDILKRHFQKCSIRRGNPTGASHLSHPQAHVKKNAQAQKPLGNEGDMNHLNGLSNLPLGRMVEPASQIVTGGNPIDGEVIDPCLIEA